MRSPWSILAVLVMGTACTAAAAAVTPAAEWRDIRRSPLRAFTPAQPKRVVFGNGMVVFIQEDHELPLIQTTLTIRGGAREEDPAKVGLASLYWRVWRTGGTKTRTGDELDELLATRAAELETSMDLDSSSISFNCLKENLDEVFPVFLEVLREPEFRQDKIDLARRLVGSSIVRRNDDPGAIAQREAQKLGYGAWPYTRQVEFATLAAVTRDDLLAWHKKFVHPGNMILGVIGDFDTAAMEAQLRKAFASLPAGTPVKHARGARLPGGKPGYYLVEKGDVNQTTIRMVHLGTTVDNPDYYAIEVANEIIGGGFSSRLFSSIRTRKGLAYVVGGGIGTDYSDPGLVSMVTSTKSETTAAAIDALFEEIDNFKKVPPTSEELQKAKDALLNSFVFNVNQRYKILSRRMTYEFHGYPLDTLERYPAGIEKVTLADVARALETYIHKDKLAVVVVGKSADFDRPLTSFGPVTPINVTIPPPPGAPKAP